MVGVERQVSGLRATTGAVRTKHSVSSPGASPDRWPNWSLALPISQEELEQHDLARGIAQALKQEGL